MANRLNTDRDPISILPFAWLAFLLVGFLVAGCLVPGSERSEETADAGSERPEPRWASEPERYERSSDDPAVLREALEQAREEIEELEADRERLTTTLAECQDRNVRFRDGLERAVDELNRRSNELPDRLRREVERSESRPRSRSRSGSREAQPSFSIRNGPRISAIGPDVRVTGTVYNGGQASGYATVFVELTLDGEPLDSATTTVYVTPRQREPWEVTLYNVSADGVVRATATVE